MKTGKLSTKNFALAGGILWGLAMTGVGLLNWWRPGYGQEFLGVLASIYPKYSGPTGALDSVGILGTLAFLNGAVGGFFFAAIYNFFKIKHHDIGEPPAGQ